MVGQPIYKVIYNDLLEMINSGSLKTGDRVPSEMELSRTYNVSRITSKRALELLAEQGYVIRRPGKGTFVSNTSRQKGGKNQDSRRTIGFIIPDFSDSFGTKLIYGIEEGCKDSGYRLILRLTRDQVNEEEKAISSLSDVSGILLLPIHGEFYNPEILKLILNKKPLVFVDRKLRGLAAPAVTTNNPEAAEEGVKHLLGLGHRNIAFFSGPVIHTSTVEDRFQGYIRAHSGHKISHNPRFLCHELSSAWTWPFYSPERISADMKTAVNHLKTRPEITAAFVAEYSMAIIVKAAAESLGRKIPADFSILTFDAPPSIAETPPYTHLCQDEYSIAKGAVEILHKIISGVIPASSPGMQVPAKLVIGASAGPLKTAKQIRRNIS